MGCGTARFSNGSMRNQKGIDILTLAVRPDQGGGGEVSGSGGRIEAEKIQDGAFDAVIVAGFLALMAVMHHD